VKIGPSGPSPSHTAQRSNVLQPTYSNRRPPVSAGYRNSPACPAPRSSSPTIRPSPEHHRRPLGRPTNRVVSGLGSHGSTIARSSWVNGRRG
jgi:hypothetical protein